MQSQLVTCPASGCGQPFLHLATEQAQSRACKECGLQYCCVRCRDRDKYGAHSPCILSHLTDSNYNMLQPTYSRHIVLMLLEDPNNAVKAATLQRVGRIILWPAPQFTDFAKMARLAHWTQGGLVSSLAMCLVNLRDEVRGAVLGIPTTPPPPPPPVGTITAPAAPGDCPSLPGALVASLEVLQRLLTPARDGDKQQGVPPYAQLLSRPACQEVATTLVAGLKGQAISALVEMVIAKGIGGKQALLLLDEMLGQLVALLCQNQLALGPKANAANGVNGVNQGPGRPTSAQHQAQGCLAPAGPQEAAGVLEEQQIPGGAVGSAPRAKDAAQGKPPALRQGLSQEVACTKLRAAVAAGLQPPARPALARTWLWRWSPFAANPAPGAAPTPVQLPASPGVVLKTLPLLV